MHARRLIQRHFSEGLAEHESERLRAHLATCERCRKEYDCLAMLRRAAAGRQQSRAEVAGVRARVLARVASPEPESSIPRAQPQSWIGWLAPAISRALVAATVALLLVFHPELPEVLFKGGVAAAVDDFQVVAIFERPGRPPQMRLVAEGGELLLDELIQFRYLSSDPRQRFLYLLGVDDSLRPMDYFPRPQAGESMAIRPTLRMEPVDNSIRLAARHHPGRLWIFALFSPRPLPRQEVHAALARARTRGLRAELASRIDWGSDVAPVVRQFKVVDEHR